MRPIKKGRAVRRLQMATPVAVVILAFLIFAPPSLADPGRPGLTKATRAVYPSAGEGGGVLGAGGGGGAEGPVAGGDGLPFTGLSAPLVLLAGLIVMGVGLTLRVTSGRLTDSG